MSIKRKEKISKKSKKVFPTIFFVYFFAVRVPFNQQNSAQQSLAQPSTCNERLGQLVGDIFIGHEMIPQVLDLPPDSPLELTYR